MNKVCIIIPYFGKFPNYFDFWLKSAYYNDKFDFLIFTDNKSYHTQNNVKFIHMNFEAFKKLLQKQVEFPICLNEPYKLCDYRPVYGSALQKYISKYEFWGFGDVDLILGDLSKFITPEILMNYDKIYNLGHLTLLRNNKICNYLWKSKHHIKNAYRYDEAFKTPYTCHFDENDGLTKISEKLNIKSYIRTDFADIDRTRFNFRLLGIQDKLVPGIFIWNKGRLIYKFIDNNKVQIKEIGYAHFQKRKIEVEENNANLNYISSFAIIPNEILCNSNNNYEKYLKTQKIISKYEYYTVSRRNEIINNIKKHALQQRIYRKFFRNMNRYFLDKK
ncbi:DUF6625 family protein [Lactobacillus helveticus]|uniref:DUF6625 family protein n=1 Tax=Lactobacillus helveticus TaxID=1587 RepID=UPI000933638F|nr:DUF6625 family protein [Lactobacillus helveticus]